MPWHHIIPKHEWKKRFGNLKGVNAQDNQVNLTQPQHIQTHGFLYELNGNEFDRLAVLRMSGQIDNGELQRRVASATHRGRKHTKEQNRKHSSFMKNNQHSKGKHYGHGNKNASVKRTQEQILAQSIRMTGTKQSEERKKAQADRQHGVKRGPYKKRHHAII